MALKATTGAGAVTADNLGGASVEPPGPVTVRVTVSRPRSGRCENGLVAVLVVPSPKLQLRLLIDPLEVSVKVTVSGAVPRSVSP